MTTNPRDPLLGAARVLLILMMGVMVLIGATGALGVPTLFILRDRFAAKFAAEGLPPESPVALAVVAGLVLICAVLGFFFFRHLYRIVGTVGEGDPFIPVNAERLSAMGWIVVAVHVAAIPMIAIAAWVVRHADKAKADIDVHFDNGFDPTGILLALILFILARVFREGTRMREELEGTV